MSHAENATTVDQLVSETDYVQLSRLVIEHAWRADNGRADTIHELYVDDGELTLPPGLCAVVTRCVREAGSSSITRRGERSATSAETCASFTTATIGPSARQC